MVLSFHIVHVWEESSLHFSQQESSQKIYYQRKLRGIHTTGETEANLLLFFTMNMTDPNHLPLLILCLQLQQLLQL